MLRGECSDKSQAPGRTLTQDSGLWNPPESYPVQPIFHANLVNQSYPPFRSRFTHRPGQLRGLDSRYKETRVGGKQVPLDMDWHPLIQYFRLHL